MKFQITDAPIDEARLKKDLLHDSAGGFVSFEGWVRDHNEGKSVSSLEYEAFNEMCESEAQVIIDEALTKYKIIDCYVIHRTGHLQIGELAVWIGVTAAHRGAAFDACQYLIDEIKVRLPIWKKEHYMDGMAEWVNCRECYKRSRQHKHSDSCGHSHSHSHKDELVLSEAKEEEFYSKQICIPSIGKKGQAKLKKSKVAVVGVGGLGAPVIQGLAASGVGHLGIFDFDVLNISNLHRQSIYSSKDIGLKKSMLAKKFAESLNPFIQVEAFDTKVSLDNVEELLSKFDYVVDCTDNFETKFLLHDFCYLNKKVLVQGAIYQFEGQVQTFDFTKESSCMRCLWSEIPDSSCFGTCVDVGVLGPVTVAIGNFQSLEVLRHILFSKAEYDSQTLFFNFKDHDTLLVAREKSESCKLCSAGSSPTLQALHEVQGWERDQPSDDFLLVDIRSIGEVAADPRGLTHSPYSEGQDFAFSDTSKTLFVCQRGVRSARLVQKLRAQGFKNAYSLKGGVSSLQGSLS